MRKWLALAFLAGVLLGATAGAGGMLIAFPFLFPPPIVAETAPAGAATGQVGAFQFDEQAPGRDLVHWANGSGGVYRVDGATVIRLGDDFKAGPGPNYWIYLNTKFARDEESFLADAGRIKITPLKSFKRGQNYVLPGEIRLEDFTALTIWCESFSAYIASAKLPPSGP
jgi:hypothetical protein